MIMLFINPILIAAAVIPAAWLLSYVYRKDRLEKESTGLLAQLVFLGVVSTFLAVITEGIGSYILDAALEEGSFAYNFLLYFAVVALSEEGFKYLILKRRTWRSPEFNCQFDGVVYAVFVSLGFAIWENIGYVLMSGLATALVRAVTAIPGHASFGVLMGAFYGMARRCENMGDYALSKRYRRFAVLLPSLAHGFYDFIASSETAGTEWVFLAFIVILFFWCSRLVKRLSDSDSYIGGGTF